MNNLFDQRQHKAYDKVVTSVFMLMQLWTLEKYQQWL